MNESRRRGVTRAYVGGLIFAVVILALAVLIAAWAYLSWMLGGGPVVTPGVNFAASPLIVLVLLGMLSLILWMQSVVLLGGRKTPSWPHVLLAAVGGYLVWCLGGLLVGMSVEETWLSPFAASLGVIWGLSTLLCWSILARRVYTDRPTPQWPWEKRGESGPDWANTDDNPWGGDR
ncbi:MAG: hypothetical protein GX814_10090 [Microbacteriaceae bacterium]|nr:hypothetical protein [Microbacteriaceae bacterium]